MGSHILELNTMILIGFACNNTLDNTLLNGFKHIFPCKSLFSFGPVVWPSAIEPLCVINDMNFLLLSVNKCKRIIDLAFVIDSSGSIRPQEWPQVIKFVKKVLERFDVSKGGTHVGVISYSTNTNLHFRFNTIKGKHRDHEVQNLVNEIPRLRGFTLPYKALEMANNELFSSRGGMREAAKKVFERVE